MCPGPRQVHVRLGDGEGGLDLNMKPGCWRSGNRGERAGAKPRIRRLAELVESDASCSPPVSDAEPGPELRVTPDV